jgi:hypothetical protein
MHFMAVKLDGRESRMPAALSPQLMLCIHGATSIKGSDGSLLRRPRLVLNGACLGARHSYSEPETIVISVMFRPGLLREVLPISVREINSGFLDLGDIVGGERVQALFDAIVAPRLNPTYGMRYAACPESSREINVRHIGPGMPP